MKPKIKPIYWPNVLGIDAAVIAAAWLAALAQSAQHSIGAAPYCVLSLSVWLTYTADRLYDVRSRPLSDLQSLRHQFAKQYRGLLWKIWLGVLVVNLAIATQLTPQQLTNGCLLLAACLSYTALNQKLSCRYFPKEICVALIYASGLFIFLPKEAPLGFAFAFSCVCLLNCLIISKKETDIDARMQTHSIGAHISTLSIRILGISTLLICLGFAQQFATDLVTATLTLLALYEFRDRVSIEDFRTTADAILLIAAVMAQT